MFEECTDTLTRIWLTDLAKELPRAHLHGFDNVVDGFPPREWLPENVRLEQLDIFQPIPKTLLGQYDIVHVRLFMLVIRNDDPGPVLENLVRLLSMYPLDRSPLSTKERCSVVAASELAPRYTACDALKRSLTTTIEPGGHLLWVEHNPTDARIESISPNLKSDAWQVIQGLSDGPRALRKYRLDTPFLATH